jgi:hypothetical protein
VELIGRSPVREKAGSNGKDDISQSVNSQSGRRRRDTQAMSGKALDEKGGVDI